MNTGTALKPGIGLWWSDTSGRIELELLPSHVRMGGHGGQCDDDIAYLRTFLYIRWQLNALDADLVRTVLREYAAWDEDDLQDDDGNLSRLLWLACGELTDELLMKETT